MPALHLPDYPTENGDFYSAGQDWLSSRKWRIFVRIFRTFQRKELPQSSGRLVGSSENSSDLGGFPGNLGGREISRRDANVKNRSGFRLCGTCGL